MIWSNKVAIVHGFLECGRLPAAQGYAKDMLSKSEHGMMLSKQELDFIYSVIDANKLKDVKLTRNGISK